MVDLASTILGGFQDDLVTLFGETLGWIIGHSIIAIIFAVIVLGIRERNHVIENSGIGKNEAFDFGVFLLLTFALHHTFTNTFDFDSMASLGLGIVSALSLRWMVTVLG